MHVLPVCKEYSLAWSETILLLQRVGDIGMLLKGEIMHRIFVQQCIKCLVTVIAHSPCYWFGSVHQRQLANSKHWHSLSCEDHMCTTRVCNI